MVRHMIPSTCKVAVLASLCCFSGAASAVTVYYQPTPYPSNISKGVHILDGWLPSKYYGRTFQRDGMLQVGGWGDMYRTYIQFDLRGLPTKVTGAELRLYAFPKGDRSTQAGFQVVNPGGDWATSSLGTSLTWDRQPTGSNKLVTTVSPGAKSGFWSIPLTGLYNSWRTGTVRNRGVMLNPLGTNNNFNLWRSSRYGSDGQRPLLRLTFTPPAGTPTFKMPLERGLQWLVTTEVGGYDCNGEYDQYHDGSHYFSVDFSWRNRDRNGRQKYKSPDSGAQIPVLAAADGWVKDAVTRTDDSRYKDNGFFVAIAHHSSQNLNRGFSTRYLHLKSRPLVTSGRVTQGQVIGYMGNTGKSYGPHLHFGMRYDGTGAETTDARYAVVSGWLMKSFQTECSNRSPNRYYLSS